MSISNLLVPNDLSINCFNLNVENGLTLPTTGATGANLNYYENYHFSASFTGIWAANQPCNIDITRIGNQVTFQMTSDVLATATTASTIALVISGGIPARFRPVTDIHSACVIKDNGIDNAAGVLLLQTSTGALKVSNANSTNFTGTGNSGVYGFAISYLIS